MNIKVLTSILTLTLFIAGGCKEENDSFIRTSETEVIIPTADEQEAIVKIETNLKDLVVSIPEKDWGWCNATIENNQVRISVTFNDSPEQTRNTIITLQHKNKVYHQVPVTQPPRPYNTEKELIAFSIPAHINNLEEEITATIDQEKKTIHLTTSAFISNIKQLIVNFEATGNLFIGDVPQVSGETANSFTDQLIYTVVAEDGSKNQYTVVAEGPMFTGLPVFNINIEGGMEVVEKKEKLPSVLCLVDPINNGYDINQQEITIRGRGNTSWGHPKKPYRIDFPSKTSLFGLPKAKKWVLLSNWQDPTLLMNDVAFEMGRRLGMPFTHSSIHVELFINGTHRGNYQLTEQKEIGEGRVDVDKKGGFLLELDAYYDEDYKFRSNHLNLPVMVADPSLKDDSEMIPIQNAFQAMEDALFEEDFPNNSYEEHTDVKSLIDFILINEIVANQELYHPKSTYCHKDKNSKIVWGPLWDFDWAYGFKYPDKYFSSNIVNFHAKNNVVDPGARFFTRFFQIPDFRNQYVQRWKEVKPLIQGMDQYIAQMGEKLEKSQKENFKININNPPAKKDDYNQIISQLREWIGQRIQFLDSEFDKF